MNIPLPSGSDDTTYLQAMQQQVLPALEKFRPQLCCISAGFDAHREDPLASMKLSTQAYFQMTQQIVDSCKKVGCVGIVSFLEGGYHYENLAHSVEAHLQGLLLW